MHICIFTFFCQYHSIIFISEIIYSTVWLKMLTLAKYLVFHNNFWGKEGRTSYWTDRERG